MRGRRAAPGATQTVAWTIYAPRNNTAFIELRLQQATRIQSDLTSSEEALPPSDLRIMTEVTNPSW